MEDKKVVIFITKWWRTRGIIKANAVELTYEKKNAGKNDAPRVYYEVTDKWVGHIRTFEKNAAFLSRKEAVADAEKKRVVYLDGLKKSIKKIENYEPKIVDGRDKEHL